MVPSTDEQSSAPQTATADRAQDQPVETAPGGTAPPADQTSPPGEIAAGTPATPTGGDAASPVSPAAQLPPPPPNLLLYTVLGLLCIGVCLWLVFSWTGYKNRYSQQVEGWHLGATKMIEVTLIREDKQNLACASDKSFEGIHCAFHANQQPWGPGPETDGTALQPYNTVKNELFLAAGLWVSPTLSGELPTTRFTVVCNYHVKGVLKSVSLRWSPTGSFGPVDQSVTVGTLTDCVIPQ
jgi:hypothetical protein